METGLVSSSDRLLRIPLRHLARDRIQRAIVSGEFKPGQKLHEAEVARWLDVSRGLVREVFRELETFGILVNVPYRGTYVKQLPPERVAEFYTLRSNLEQFAAELAATRASDGDLRGLSEVIEAMHRAAQAGDACGVAENDLLFHERLCEISRHQLLRDVLTRLLVQTPMFVSATTVIYSLFSSMEDVVGVHDKILEALIRRDPQTARAAVATNFSDVLRRFNAHVESTPIP